MTRRTLLLHGLAWTLFTIVSVLLVDGPLARQLQSMPADAISFLRSTLTVVENIFGFPISKWLTGGVLLLAALVCFAFPTRRALAWTLLFTSAAQLTSRLLAGMLKNVFGRSRPFEVLADPQLHDRFFVDGSSFPSGHAAHFWPLFFAAAMAFPRWRWPLLVLAIFVSLSRIAVNDHYLGDITASIAISAFVTWALARWRIGD